MFCRGPSQIYMAGYLEHQAGGSYRSAACAPCAAYRASYLGRCRLMAASVPARLPGSSGRTGRAALRYRSCTRTCARRWTAPHSYLESVDKTDDVSLLDKRGMRQRRARFGRPAPRARLRAPQSRPAGRSGPCRESGEGLPAGPQPSPLHSPPKPRAG